MKTFLAFFVSIIIGVAFGAPICTNSGTVTLPPPSPNQVDKVLYVIIHGPAYDNDMLTGFNVLNAYITAPSSATLFYLSFNGPVLDLSPGYTQIWVCDLSQNLPAAGYVWTDLSPNHMDAYTKIANWWLANGKNNIICDARYISGLWTVGNRPHRPEANLIYNYYENLRKRGGGIVLLTDHAEFGPGTVQGTSGFEIGINEINKKIGIEEFTGYFYAPPYTLKVDVGSELMNYPYFAPHTQVGNDWFLWDDSSTGFSPSNLQPNGLIMYPAGWHSDQNGGILQPGISTTIRGTVGFLVELTSPLCDESFLVGTNIVFNGNVGTGIDTTGVAPYNYVWSSDDLGILNGGNNANGIFSFNTNTLTVGDRLITLKVTDAQDLVAEAKVTIHITEPQCVADGTYHTQSEGDWGDACAEFPTGCYRDDNFDACFPNGLDVGCICISASKKSTCGGYHLHFDSSADIENFLPQLGAPGVLDHDYVNPTNPPPMSTSSGNFGGQVTALALSLGFSACDPTFHTDCGKLEDLYVCDDRCKNCKRNNNCKRNSGCNSLRLEDEEYDERTNKNTNFNNNNNGKPKYANCEAYYGMKISEIFQTASKVLGGCANCPEIGKKTMEMEMEDRNNKNNGNHCVRNSNCRKNEAARNNNNCSRNQSCRTNGNCCCCQTQNPDPLCDPALLNACVTYINQAFIFGKTLDDVDSGKIFKENGCTCGGDGFEWTATVNGQVVVLDPFVVFTDMGDYYGYSKAGGDVSSANTPDGLEDSNHNKALVEFVTDGFGNHNLLVIYDTPNDADGGDAQTQIIHSGNLDGATFVVQDDTGEGLSISPGLATTNHIWSPCCTDGYVFGPIPNLACFTFVLGPTTGITALRLASKGAPGGTAIEVPKTDGDSITVDICNRCKQA